MATTLAVFAHLDDRFVPAGLLTMAEMRISVDGERPFRFNVNTDFG